MTIEGAAGRAGRGRRAAAAAGLVLALALAYAGAWAVVAGELTTAAEHWIDERRAEGYAVRADRLDVVGFPFDLRLEVPDPAIAAPPAAGGWTWSGRRVVARGGPFDWSRLRIDVEGEQTLELRVAGRWTRMNATAARFRLEIAAGGPAAAGRLTVEDLTVEDEDGEAVRVEALAGELVEVRAAGGAGAGEVRTFALRAETVALPESLGLVLGHEVSHLAIDGRLAGPVGGRTVADALGRWRAAGGRLEVERLDVDYGPVLIAGDGTLALDGDDQPAGAFSLRVWGLPRALDALVAEGLMGRQEAAVAKVVLSVLAEDAGDGGPRVVRVPLVLRDRWLHAGPVRLLRLPTVRWAGAGV